MSILLFLIFKNTTNIISDLLSPMTNSMQEKLFKIRRKFKDVLAHGNFEDYVVSKGENGKYSINLERKLLI